MEKCCCISSALVFVGEFFFVLHGCERGMNDVDVMIIDRTSISGRLDVLAL